MLSYLTAIMASAMIFFSPASDNKKPDTTAAEVQAAIATCHGVSPSNVVLHSGRTYTLTGFGSGSGSFTTEFRPGFGNYYLKVYKSGQSEPCSVTIVDEDIDGF